MAFFFLGFTGQAQQLNDSVRAYSDSIVPVSVVDEPIFTENSENSISRKSQTTEAVADTLNIDVESVFKPDPAKAIWLGAIIPGYGQIVNRKYWKLPFVYGGFMGFTYAISLNNSRYASYKNAYRDITDDDPTTNYHLKILPRGYTLEDYPGGAATYTQRLKSAQDQFRQWRDLSIILSVGYYALVLLDAFVDAHLYDFDISPDLVLNLTPTRIEFNQFSNSRSAYGLQCNIRF
ncbi:MAG: DUF5683 domain-containing protein [Paludibacteraceae bacterium]